MTDANDSKGFYDNLNRGFGGKGSNSDFNMPIRKSDYKKQPSKYVMPLLSMGVMLIFGSGLLWVVSGEIECTQEQKVIEPHLCSDISFMDKYMPIGLIIGFMLVILAIIISLPTDEKPKTDQVK